MAWSRTAVLCAPVGCVDRRGCPEGVADAGLVSVEVAGDGTGLASAQRLCLVGADSVLDDTGPAVIGGGQGAVHDDREVGAAAGAEDVVVESGVLGPDAVVGTAEAGFAGEACQLTIGDAVAGG
jgi:hypothetical protein